MATVSVSADDRVVSQAEFARLRGVHRSRVTRYVQEGKIGGDALVQDGRSVKIRVARAMAQLSERLDIGQQLGNGLDARTVAPEGPAGAAGGSLFGGASSPAAGPVEDDSIEAQIKRERLRAAQIANRKAAEEEAERKGRFMETAAGRSQMAAVTGTVLQSFEGGLPNMARAVAARFEIPQRDVLHLLQTEFRTVRENAVKRAAKRLEGVPATVESVLEADGDGEATA